MTLRQADASTEVLASDVMLGTSLHGSKSFSVDDEEVFLNAQCGDFVAISSKQQDTPSSWWIGQIISRFGNSVDPTVNTLFQVIDVDTGAVKTINADCVKGII